jgi:SAM-dependent methyltransferase
MKKCLICGIEVNASKLGQKGKYTLYQCPICELCFFDPIDYSQDRYQKSYEGELFDEFVNYNYLLSVEFAKAKSPYLEYFLLPHERIGMKFIKKFFNPPAPVLEIGFGPGRFLYYLKREGYQPLGLEIAQEPVNLLRKEGFNVAVGSIDNYPKKWIEPQAIVLFEVLEHLADPLGFLVSIHRGFPNSMLLISVPNPKRLAAQYDYDSPPHHYTRWTKRALTYLIKKAGYKPFVKELPLTIEELSLYPIRTGLLNKYFRKNRKVISPVINLPFSNLLQRELIFIRIRRWLLFWVKIYFAMKGYSSISLFGIGLPICASK